MRIIISIFLVVGGLGLLALAIAPLAIYEVLFAPYYSSLISPVVGSQVAGVEDFQNTFLDYTKVSNWFPTAPKGQEVPLNVKNYTISIPKLNIEKATVNIGGEDLSKSLIQYPGTAYPGKIGNSVIFGHSILPIFYDPKNYLAIFSTLPTLKKGDEVIVNYDGITYFYMVEDLFEVLPSDISVLEQRSDNSYLTLVTCTPPGHPLKPRRLIVRAKLSPNI